MPAPGPAVARSPTKRVLAGVKQPLMGAEPEIDAKCPVCHVTLHVGSEAAAGQHVECGLCGAQLEVQLEDGAPVLRPI